MKLRFGVGAFGVVACVSGSAFAQQPYQPPPPQQYPPPPQQQPYPPPPQQYPPPQQQPYPPPPQQYPPPQQQPYPPPPQQYPPPQQQPYPPPPQQYPPPPQQYPPPPYPPQYPPPQQQLPPQPGQPAPGTPGAPAVNNSQKPRGSGEMFFLYGTSIAYGVGTGVWIDALANVKDPGIAIIAPIGLGAAMPVGVYFLDQNVNLHYGTPASMSSGAILGAIEGIAISGTQWQHTHEKNQDWSLAGYSTITFIGASGGAFGGYAFGEWAHLDPKNMAFIGSGAGWGAITGTLLGAGVENGPDWKDGGSIGGLVGYNAGIAGAGAMSFIFQPSYYSLKWMWLGYLIGTAGGSIVYPFYLLDSNASQDIHHGLVANALGGLAGIGLAGALTAGTNDDGQKSAINELPFQLGVAPTRGGATIQAAGLW